MNENYAVNIAAMDFMNMGLETVYMETANWNAAVDIGMKAYQALLEEVYTTPKPGLVDRYSCGAHKDMDLHTFERSAEALKPWFIRMALQGTTLHCTCEELFCEIRKNGLFAEEAMYRATEGVNTHKGLIFTLGIYSAAAGRCMKEYGVITAEKLCEIQQKMTARILVKELVELENRRAISHGEKNLAKYGTSGVRGEAICGYPSLWQIALPVLHRGRMEQREWNLVKLQTLMTLMGSTEDSNILARHNPQVLREVQAEATNFVRMGGAYAANAVERLQRMDADYIRRNISAGGSADLLAAAVFLEMLLND